MASLSSISGISSGVDFPALTDQIIALERRPADRLQSIIDKDKKRTDALETFRTLLTNLKTAATAFKDGTGLDAYNTSVSGADSTGRMLLAATASAGARSGSYVVEIETLARAQKTSGTTQTSGTDPLGYAGDFTIGAANITVSATDSLTAIRDRINAANTGLTPTKVTASILSVSPTDQRLILTSDVSGTAGAFTPTDVNGGTVLQSLGLTGPPSPPGVDAKFTIDGVAFTRSSNTVGDAIAGVTLTLTAAELGRTATVGIERQPVAAKGAATAFVEAYNKIAGFVRDQSKVGAPLLGDASIRVTRSALAQSLLVPAAGGVDGMSTLGNLGISLTRDGTLTLNSATLESAYNTRNSEMRSVLADRGAALLTILDEQLSAGTGLLDQKKRAIETRGGKMATRIVDIDSRLEKRRAALLAQFARSEAAIGTLKSIQDSLGSQIKSLTASKD
jgi:flagellar hook-associated protein 2